jgi:hypothetical protein
MSHENYRIQNKQNVHYAGHKTAFRLFQREGNYFSLVGQFYIPGWDCSDYQCINAALQQMSDTEGEG